MYRSLYAFQSAEPNSLHFAAGETFLILERSNKHWWLGSRCSSGETGFIPASYIEKIQVNESLISRVCVFVPVNVTSDLQVKRNVKAELMRSRETDCAVYVLQCRPRGS